MSSENLTFTIQGDSEGYITFECPFCGSEFKLQADDFQNEDEPFDEIFCPYCGLAKNKNEFLSSDVIEKAQALAYNYMVEEINKTFNKMKRSFNSSKSIIKMEFKPLKKVTTKELKDKDTTEVEFTCDCCERRVKVLYCVGKSKIFCPYCGVDL